MRQNPAMALDPVAMTAFAATLANMSEDEIRKAKRLYVLNAITDYHTAMRTMRPMLIVMGIMCIIPIFLIVFIPAFMGYKTMVNAGREKILNAIEVWRDDLGDDYDGLKRRIEGESNSRQRY